MIDRENPPASGTPPILEPLSPAKERLDNGLDILTIRRDSVPELCLRLVVPGGAAATPVAKAGIASLVGRLLPEGAAGKDSREMAAWIDGLGVAFGVDVGYDSTVVRMHSLSERTPEALDLLTAVVAAPDFPAREVERIRGERLDLIRRQRDEPDHVSSDLLAELLYGDTPYGRLPRGRLDTVESLDRADITAFHTDRYSPKAAALVAVGALADGFAEMVGERLAAWSGAALDVQALDSPRTPATRGTVLVDRPGSQQSVIRIGGIGLARGSDDEPQARMMNAILGGLFNSRLNLNLREDKGWTYGARSGLDLRRSAGPITIKVAVETGMTADAVSELHNEIERMSESLPSDDEMSTALGALTRSLPLRFETASQVAGKLVEQIVYGLPEDYWPRYVDELHAVTPSDVQTASRRYLQAQSLVTLVVGDAAAVAPELERLGPVDVRSVP